MRKLEINSLHSGGIITNYYCTSRCRHCLYACSPKWPKEYIGQGQLVKNLEVVKKLGCHSVHVGGGEPFLDREGLLGVVETAYGQGVRIDYVETNSSWFNQRKEDIEYLTQIRSAGLDTLLISISPFHNEHIPFKKVRALMEACHRVGMGVFPWVEEFLPDIARFDEDKKHSLKEYEQGYGPDYLKNIPGRYWIHYGGRSLGTFRKFLTGKPLQRVLDENGPCHELTETSHFHVDLYGHYVPGLCSGFSIAVEDLGKALDEEKYPILSMLHAQGIGAFLQMAMEQHGFSPKESYVNKCELCLDIRKYLVLDKNIPSHELHPRYFYQEL